MRAGAEIDYVIGWLGLRLKWKTLWRHRHTFAETAAGVAIGDQVDYRQPLGVLGGIAHAALVKRQLISIFRHRRREIAKLLEVPGILFRRTVSRLSVTELGQDFAPLRAEQEAGEIASRCLVLRSAYDPKRLCKRPV
jgi:hypothetical protein